VSKFLIGAAGVLLSCGVVARGDTLYISYSNSDSYVEKYTSGGLNGVNTDEGPIANSTTDTATPNGIAFNSHGYLFVANDGNNTITEFAPNGSYVGVYASGLSQPAAIAFDAYGDLYVVNAGNGTIVKIEPGGGAPTVFASGFSSPQGLAFGPDGYLYVTDQGSNSIKKISPSGQISTFYQDGSYTVVNQLEGLAFDSKGNLYVASYRNNTIEELHTSGTTVTASVFADNPPNPNGPPDPNNPGDVADPTDPEGIYNPIGLAFDSSGDLFVANYHHTQVEGEPYEGHGISYMDEYSSTGTLLDEFTGNLSLPGADQNLRDGNYIAIETNAGVPVLMPVPEPKSGMLMLMAGGLAGIVWIRRALLPARGRTSRPKP